MHYIDVVWHHNFNDDPIRMVSELREDEFEMRKLEFFLDGRVGYSQRIGPKFWDVLEVGGTRLGDQPVGTLEEINSTGEFLGVAMSKEDFEKLWISHGPKVQNSNV